MSECFTPKVSIIIPVYNGANFMREAIESAIAQTYDNFEILVVNDGSNDDGETERIALSYGEKITYFSKENGGVSSALNYGIQHMTGSYFSWLSHDDKYEPTKLADAVALLNRVNPNEREKTVAFTGGYYIDSHSKRSKSFPSHFETGRLYSGNEVIVTMLQNNTLNGCCMLIPKEAFEKYGGFDEELRYNQDALMWYKLFSSGYFLVTDNKENVMYRLHRNQTSKLRRDLFLHDTLESSKVLIPMFAARGGKEQKLLYYYTKNIARNNCPEVLKKCISYGREKRRFSRWDIVCFNTCLVYGKLRYLAKEIYRKALLK